MKKRVLFILNEPLVKAGAQSVIMSIVESLSDNYIFDIVLFNNCEGYYDKEFENYGGCIYRIPDKIYKNSFFNKAYSYVKDFDKYPKIKKIIKTNKYDIVHCHNGLDAWYILKIAKKNSVSIRISHCHSILQSKVNIVRRIKNYLDKKNINRYATNTISCSSIARDRMYIKNDKNLVLGNAYDDKKFYYRNLENSQNINIVQIGYFSNNKNQLFSVNVLKEIVKEYKDTKLHLIGFENEKGYQDVLLETIKQNKMEDNVIFYEQDCNALEVMKISNYLIMPSIKEAFGIALLEAQSVGLKCFVSNTVPTDANVGGCIFFDLKDGYTKCAKLIIDDFKLTNGKHTKYDCLKYTKNEISNAYLKLYEGE